MKFKVTWGKKLIAGILLAAVVVGGTAAPAEAAGKKSTAVVAQDNYRKTLCKGFLGKSYGRGGVAVWLMESAVTAVVTHGQP